MRLFGVMFGRSDPKPVRDAMASQVTFRPLCEACGAGNVTAHHIIPVHVDPSLADKAFNMISLCSRCHLVHGHNGNWKHYVPNIREVLATRKVEQ